MAYKRFSRQFLLPYLLLVLLTFILAYSLVVAHWYFTSAILIVLVTGMLFYIKKQIDTVNNQLKQLFELNRGGDFSTRMITKSTDPSLKAVYTEINRWQQYIQELQQAQAQVKDLTNEVLSHLPLGVFLFDENKSLEYSNEIARDFLNYKSLSDEDLLKERAPYFFNQLEKLREEGKIELSLNKNGEKQQWRVNYRKFHTELKGYELFIVQNVQAQLERTQGQLSEQIMHVLTHEIMNSISPVHSLIDTLSIQLKDVEDSGEMVKIDQEAYSDILTGVGIIKKRSEGLMEFVERYGMLARLPKLKMESIDLDAFLSDIEKLTAAELQNHHVQFELQVLSRNIRMRGDYRLLEQVIINLVKNARESIEEIEGGKIRLQFSKGDGYNYITVSDNGAGVDSEIQDNIFLPFFTTKRRGSGIGLSLSRKIIDAHNGRLYLRQRDSETEFRIELPD